MGEIRQQRPVLLVIAAFSRHPDALDWARSAASAQWGPVALTSDLFEFHETPFYERTMGTGLRKLFWAFERLIDAAILPDIKLQTNDWEIAYRLQGGQPDARPINLDPGYLTEAKFVLATTKDRDHRLYLRQGIFAEGTLFYQAGKWCPRDWTYPDYHRADYHQFFTRCRDYLRQRYQAGCETTDG